MNITRTRRSATLQYIAYLVQIKVVQYIRDTLLTCNCLLTCMCNLVDRDNCFGGTCCLHVYGGFLFSLLPLKMIWSFLRTTVSHWLARRRGSYASFPISVPFPCSMQFEPED
jgi:hypothetical protein